MRSEGYTLIEVAIAITVLVGLMVCVGSLFLQSSDGMQYFSNVGTADTSLQRALDLIADDLRQSQVSGIAIAPAFDFDAVTLTRRFGESDTATVTYTVDGGRALIRTMTTPGPQVESAAIAHDVDGLDALNQKGFRVVRVGTSNLYTVSLRVVASINGGERTTRTFATTVGTRS
jgi:type II secretory pathway pseudopilin PulG